MEAKHTKGPWRLSEGYLIGPDNNLIKISLRENASAHAKEEEVANARLIAAAPEMHDLLKMAYNKLSVLQQEEANFSDFQKNSPTPISYYLTKIETVLNKLNPTP